ncbi:MAG TPA: D-glycerate dehydrogenase [Terriglobia bacterium]|nr:D-glycerate dehydrogenase [Terriglobia bacterium]
MSTKRSIFATHALPPEVLELLSARCEVHEYRESGIIRPERLAAACRELNIEGILLIGGRITAEIIGEAKDLRAISTASVGYDHIDVAACTARRIAVTTATGSLEETTADLAFALLLAIARRIPEADSFLREGRWSHWDWELLWGANVHHKVLGLVGFGGIGRAMARRGLGFSMRILYHARRRVPKAIEGELRAQIIDLETLLRESDFVSLHVPYTLDTNHLIQARELSWMKPSAFLINTARGRVVDEQALVEALKTGKIAGAALDVYEQEPKVHPDLLKLENVVLTPHIGSGTRETRMEMVRVAAQNLLASMDGQRPPNLINHEIFGS